MKKLLLAINIAAIALLGLAGIYVVPKAIAQCTGVFPSNTLCGNLSGSPRPPAAFSAGGTILAPGATTSGHIVTFGNTLGTSLSDTTAIATSQSLTISAPFFVGTTTVSGTISASGSAVIGGPNPWIDVTSGAHGCAKAVGDGSNDNTTAFQCQLNYISLHSGAGVGNAGILWLPCGDYKITGTLSVAAGTTIATPNPICGELDISSVDSTAIAVPASANGNDFVTFQNLNVSCFFNAAAVNSCVKIGANAVANGYNVFFSGGKFGLENHGTDGYWFGGYICGSNTTTGGCLSENGGNWYFHLKLDGTVKYSWFVGPAESTGGHEMGCVLCDFSNATEAIHIDDGGSGTRAQVIVSEGIIGAPVNVVNAKWVAIAASEVGTTTVSSAVPIQITGSNGAGGLFTVTGVGTQSCAGNISIICTALGVQSTPSNPTSTSSTVGVMAGLAGTFAPRITGNALVFVNGTAANSNQNRGCIVALRYGIGTGPANSTALSGTVVGNTNGQTMTSPVSGSFEPFAITGYVTGLTPGTTYWLDASQASTTASTSCALYNVTLGAVEH